MFQTLKQHVRVSKGVVSETQAYCVDLTFFQPKPDSAMDKGDAVTGPQNLMAHRNTHLSEVIKIDGQAETEEKDYYSLNGAQVRALHVPVIRPGRCRGWCQRRKRWIYG